MTGTMRAISGTAFALLLVTGWHIGVSGQQTVRTPSPLVIPSMSGGDLFRFYCATCHGLDGTGNGPVAAALTLRPADLTTIARRNGGAFPVERVERFVVGDREPTPAHGSREMPVWGPIFHALDSHDAMNRVRIANLVAFIESIQAK